LALIAFEVEFAARLTEKREPQTQHLWVVD